MPIDAVDKKILEILQNDSTVAITEIADRVGLSTSPCWRRVQKLEESGVIRARVVLLDPDKLNVGVTVFVAVRTNQHELEWLENFAKAVRDIPEVVEFYRMSGDIDYLLRVVVPDIAAYDAFYKRLIQRVKLVDVSSSFAMETIKFTTALPVNYAQ
jgi:Lrp/AsnC family transcriptional regulator, cysteine-sensing transcriptional activator